MSKPKGIKLSLIDGDVLAYRAAFASSNYTEKVAEDKVDELVEWVIDETVGFQTKSNTRIYLTGKNNFRYDITKTYKSNRKDTKKPEFLPVTRQRLVDKWGAVVVEGKEADDQIATDVTSWGDPESVVIASVDKDYLTLNCWFYNITKDKWLYSSKEDALQFFYKQILMGDNADGVVGIRGVGPKRAEKLIGDVTDECELYSICVEEYTKVFQEQVESIEKAVELAEGKVLENGQLLHLQRYDGELWAPNN